MVEHIKNIISLLPGWRTKRKIVVFESDDWGMERMASKSAFDYFKRKGLPVDKCPYNSFDMLESNEDMEILFEALESVKDKWGNPAIITANNIVANPDFKKIKNAAFQEYFYEPFTETLKRYPKHDRVLDLYQEGIKRKIFRPQFHGREHLNVARWMQALKNKNQFVSTAFQWQMYSVIFDEKRSSCRLEYLDAFGGDDNRQPKDYPTIIREGCTLFEKIHGYAASSFIAPCYTWPDRINKSLLQSGIVFLQGGRVQKSPNRTKKHGFKRYYHFTGQSNEHRQIYLQRNAYFEISDKPDKNWVDTCLKEIFLAFKFNKPAIVSSHRVNFIGGICPQNRNKNIAQFKKLLKNITRKWPDVEFMSSDQLGELIKTDK